ncbi:CPBP family glutamic-type intramembrane protease [Brucella pseudogrignonensis]
MITVATLPSYGIPYGFLGFSTFMLAIGGRKLSLFAFLLSLVTANTSGIVDATGLIALTLFLLLCIWHFWHHTQSEEMFDFPAARVISSLCVVAIAVAFFCHALPGFQNVKLINQVTMSAGAIPFTMYLNFDKVAAAWILAFCGGFFSSTTRLYGSENFSNFKRLLGWVFLSWSACASILLLFGLSIGFIAFNPKIMPFLGIWAANNLLFVTFAEETLYRGMIQGSLDRASTSSGVLSYTAVPIGALLFGLSHIYGGWIYVAMATVAGLFYGLAYKKVRLLTAPILVHFLLNLIHALFFTYPALQSSSLQTLLAPPLNPVDAFSLRSPNRCLSLNGSACAPQFENGGVILHWNSNNIASGLPLHIFDGSGALVEPYIYIPMLDSAGAFGQRSKFREWNSNPIRNEVHNLNSIDPRLASVVLRAQELTATRSVIGAGRRDLIVQKAVLWGWSKTEHSDHLTGQAVDLWPIDDFGAVNFDSQGEAEIVRAMKRAAAELGVVLDVGADWKSFKDRPHFALKAK